LSVRLSSSSYCLLFKSEINKYLNKKYNLSFNNKVFYYFSTGVVFWPNPLSQMRIRCRMNIIWFPFDEQLCSVAFGSWSFTANYLNYTILNKVVLLNNFTHNKEWSLIGYKPIRREVRYEHWLDEHTFSEIQYTILIRRKSLFVLQNYVIPAVFLCIMTLNSFFIPFPQG